MNIEELKRQLKEQGITEEDLKKDKEKNNNIERNSSRKKTATDINSENNIDIKINEEIKNEEEDGNIEEKKYIEEVLDEKIARTLNQNIRYVRNVLKMIEEGNTIPFIARYRKEETGGMSDEVLREFEQILKQYTNLLQRKEEVARLIDEQGKLTEELLDDIRLAETLSKVEDIYRPYKGKKKTRGSEARRKGLEDLSKYILAGNSLENILKKAEEFLTEEVETVEDAITGAKDIIAEDISDSADIREIVKNIYNKEAEIISTKGKEDDERQIYKMYYDFKDTISKIPSHRYLAITRGETEKKLDVKLVLDEEKLVQDIIKEIITENNNISFEYIEEIVKDSFKRLIKPSVEREIRQEVKERSDEYAINVFGDNLKELLLQSPMKNIRILGFDPGFRNGSKLACIDENGKYLEGKIVSVTMPNDDIEKGKKEIEELINKNNINIVAIGNGTASRESEKVVSEIIKGKDVKYIIVNEAGASVYSASKLGAEEFPDVNVSIRGAISIARRLQDPLSELVKIEPKAIGVGQYQHDVNQTKLEERLYNVVEDSVNKVGVDLNTATFSLISYVAGISKRQAKAIVKYREDNRKIFRKKRTFKSIWSRRKSIYTSSRIFKNI